MFKVVKRPKEYIAIKVPEDCEDVGRYVSNKFRENGILVRVNVRYGNHVITTFGEGEDQHFVKQGDMLVADYSEPRGYVVHAMSQEDFEAEFKPDDEPAKSIKAEMSTKIEGVELPDHKNTPHVRIEFDDINGVPCVWVDGKRIDRSDTGLVSISLDWHTKDPVATDHVIRAYKIEYLKGDHREGIAQGSAMGPDLFKNDIHAK
ncbi:hypothetical protein LCA12A_1322 [Lacticaseibacillus casei 12A]|uniref:hypothetical protein n=1 Tax=Lacticaseibacillus paracasei TaxID=1597 RepID=UPI0002985ACC|nr:hypothetical protein [Lacticaseibacillus paracasei]EKP99648.1 hypothetical protein LCA12A_1322 [Lacticaseibacillus casei 12A]